MIIDHGRTVAAGTVAELMGRAAGSARPVRISLERPLAADARLAATPAAILDDARTAVTASVTDVGHELSDLLRAIAGAGGKVSDVAMTGTSLQDVFIAVTGRELRE